jgi:hypothetical protein
MPEEFHCLMQRFFRVEFLGPGHETFPFFGDVLSTSEKITLLDRLVQNYFRTSASPTAYLKMTAGRKSRAGK